MKDEIQKQSQWVGFPSVINGLICQNKDNGFILTGSENNASLEDTESMDIFSVRKTILSKAERNQVKKSVVKTTARA